MLATIDALFASFGSGDSAAMLRQVYPDGRVTAIGTRGDGASNLNLTFSSRTTGCPAE